MVSNKKIYGKNSRTTNEKRTYTYLGVLVLITVVAAVFAYSYRFDSLDNNAVTDQSTLKRFANYDELKDYLKNAESSGYGYDSVLYTTMSGSARTMQTAAESSSKSSDSGSNDYSTTNIQVEGVDEADIVKNDGKYIYTLSGNKISIVDAYPAEDARVLSTIENDTKYPREIYANSDRLVVFGYAQQDYGYGGIAVIDVMPSRTIAPPDYTYYSEKTFVDVYDVSDRSNPVLVRSEVFDGNYVESRMIGDYVYFIVNAQVFLQNGEVIMPMQMRESVSDIYYIDGPYQSRVFTNIISMNVKNDQPVNKKVYMLSYSSNIYASQNNFYISYRKTPDYNIILEKTVNDVFAPVMPSELGDEIRSILSSDKTYYEKNRLISEKFYTWLNSLSVEEQSSIAQQLQERMYSFYNEINKEFEKTIIHKINVNNGAIEYKNAGEVSGDILNQFSMDEYNSNLRVATTTGHVSRSGESSSLNHIFVLDSGMSVVGTLEDLAQGERIYSARFIGNRAYLVTFKKIDPLFVIDLSNPASPTVLGKLKIPGYSDYLHPYDENHIIGIGKETVDNGNFAWYQGVKLSLFDVSDVSNPTEVSKANIGDRGTDSEALRDHKAFLFSKNKNLLVIPISLAEINESRYSGPEYPDGMPDWAYGDFVWEGAYVYELTLENGFVLKGRITHSDETENYYLYNSNIRRSLYIDNVLYTVSNKEIHANSLSDLSQIKVVKISEVNTYGKPMPL